MLNLLELRLDDEVVLRAPIEVMDTDKARAAVVKFMEQGGGYGQIDSLILSAIFRATSDEEGDYTAVLLQVQTQPSRLYVP